MAGDGQDLFEPVVQLYQRRPWTDLADSTVHIDGVRIGTLLGETISELTRYFAHMDADLRGRNGGAPDHVRHPL